MQNQNTLDLDNYLQEFNRLYGGRDNTLILAIILAVRLASQRKGHQCTENAALNFHGFVHAAQSELPELAEVLEEQLEFLRDDGVWNQDLSRATHLSFSLDLSELDPIEIGWKILDRKARNDFDDSLYFVHQREIAEVAVSWAYHADDREAFCPCHASFSFAYAYAAKGVRSVFLVGDRKAEKFAKLVAFFAGNRIEVKEESEVGDLLGRNVPNDVFVQGVCSPPWGLRVHLDKLPTTSVELKHKPATSESVFIQYLMGKVTGRCAVMVSPLMLQRTTTGDRSLKEELVKSGKLAAIIQFNDNMVSVAPMVAPALLLIDPDANQPPLMVNMTGDTFYQREGRYNRFVGKDELLEVITSEDAINTKRITVADAETNDWNLDVRRYVLSDEAQQLQSKLESMPTLPLSDVVEFIRCQAIKGEEPGEIYYEANQADIDCAGIFERPKKLLTIADAKVMTRVKRQRMLPRDVLVTVKGNVGKIGLVPSSAEGNWIAGQSFIILRLKPNGPIQDCTYLYRYLNSPMAQQALVSNAVGAGIKTIKMNDLEELPVVIPTLEQVKEASEKQQQMVSLQKQIAQLQQQIDALRHDDWLKL
ncbi:restriction endonuclease subunit S [Shewanella insulae]|uniref:restriction endonuclease subunit S n=1 Tax=Shewanella insulae TaxID=2681496 RepID=UPI002481880E|nr:restriction endonuclease subunit S [Shewanella insulae]